MIGHGDEFIPQRFSDVKQKLAPAMDALVEMKQEVAASKVAEKAEIGLAAPPEQPTGYAL